MKHDYLWAILVIFAALVVAMTVIYIEHIEKNYQKENKTVELK